MYKYIQIQKSCIKILKQETHIIKFVEKIENENFGENIEKEKFWHKIWKKKFGIFLKYKSWAEN